MNEHELYEKLIPRPTSRFLKVVCSKCRNEQIIFNKAATYVKCLVCGNELAQPKGGKAKVKAKVIHVFE